MNKLKITFIITYILTNTIVIVSCNTLGFSARTKTADIVQIPFIKNSANECYYLDQFMPTPDGLVSGKSGKTNLRYYTYKAAHYKNWENRYVVLSFYSLDDSCWSLFEEYYLND